MIFVSGTGLVFYGVGEPIYHLALNRIKAKGYLSYNELQQETINFAYFHWGIHAWMCSIIVGIALGVVFVLCLHETVQP